MFSNFGETLDMDGETWRENSEASGPAARRTAGLSLIELLVVVAIIALLMTLLMKAVGAVRDSARRQQVRAEERTLVNAIKGFVSEYGHFPFQIQYETDQTYKDGTGNSQLQGRLFMALMGTDDEANPKRTVFLESRAPGAVTCPVSGCWLDPWREHYIIAMDEDNDHKVDLRCGTLVTTIVDETVAVATTNGRSPIFSWRD
jgi:prepilin-type N-terminal cleavage/methylation domain-containing protein